MILAQSGKKDEIQFQDVILINWPCAAYDVSAYQPSTAMDQPNKFAHLMLISNLCLRKRKPAGIGAGSGHLLSR